MPCAEGPPEKAPMGSYTCRCLQIYFSIHFWNHSLNTHCGWSLKLVLVWTMESLLLLHKIALFHLLPSLKFSTFCIYFQTLQPWNDFLLSLSIINYTVNICITFSLSYKLHHFLLHIEEPGNFSSNLCRHSSLKVSKWRCTCATLIVQNSTGLGNKATVGNTSRRQLPFKLSFRKKPRSYFCIDLDSTNTHHLFAKRLETKLPQLTICSRLILGCT